MLNPKESNGPFVDNKIFNGLNFRCAQLWIFYIRAFYTLRSICVFYSFFFKASTFTTAPKRSLQPRRQPPPSQTLRPPWPRLPITVTPYRLHQQPPHCTATMVIGHPPPPHPPATMHHCHEHDGHSPSWSITRLPPTATNTLRHDQQPPWPTSATTTNHCYD